MSLNEIDHQDDAAVDAFADSVAHAIEENAGGFEPWTLRLLAVWALGGVLLTLAVATDSALLGVLGLVPLVVWVAGFYLARGERARWFGSS